MKIAFYKGFKSKNKFDWLICLFTLSKYSHCELIYNGISYSSSMRDEGVRTKEIDYTVNPECWNIYTIKTSTHSGERKLKDFYLKTKSMKYDFIGLLMNFLFLNKKYDNEDKTYCSEWCANAMNDIYNINIETSVSPGKLYKILKNKGLLK